MASLTGPGRQAAPRFDPDQHFLETALRGRTARQIRTCLRRMEPVFVVTRRWSQPPRFLEDIALDLAVGEPAIGCRTVGFRALRSRSLAETWPFMLQVLGQLGQGSRLGDSLSTAIDRQGFRAGIEESLEDAHQTSRHRLALMLHGIEHTPVDALADLVDEWSAYRGRHPEGLRVVLLLAGAERPAWLSQPELHEIELEDYSEAETIASIVARCGPLSRRRVQGLARFTGGIPAVVEAVAELVAKRGPRLDADLILHSMGPAADEMRGALDIVSALGELADRLAMLAKDGPDTEWDETDTMLLAAGLIKRIRSHGAPHVTLRAPALAALLG
ncbi:MAG: hypothetical protein GXP62_22120 [Oligoflexia bacterium]|nr:hypothetical protein [Oligoflexia bacterium]